MPLEERVATLIQKPITIAVKTGVEEAMKTMTTVFQSLLVTGGKYRDSRLGNSPSRPSPLPGTPPRENDACFKCGSTSHYFRECPKRSPRSRSPSPSPKEKKN